VTDESKPVQLNQLRASLKVLETQRTLLGDALEPVLAAVCQQIAALEAELTTASIEERRIVTILFSDIVGSTALAEAMDAKDWQNIVAAMHTMGGRTIQEHSGLVLQYLGDGLLVIFGALTPSECDAEETIRAALDLQAGLAELPSQPPLQMRVGIHTGLIILGSIGSAAKHQYTASGDTLNLAARLQSAARVHFARSLVASPGSRSISRIDRTDREDQSVGVGPIVFIQCRRTSRRDQSIEQIAAPSDG
jgi:class 3 adenylate cyclase